MGTKADRILLMGVGVLLSVQGLGARRKGEQDERGATAVEYGLLVALIAGVIVVAVAALGVKIDNAFTGVTAILP
jgi:pilus assembly protein Flp/PilA